MAERAYLSIGDVLSLLREEFPDVTISKIRFLESQGLLDPERTPSGYRKFYDGDVERLRWILRQQRENFLPLKVIKGRLEDLRGGVAPQQGGAPAGPGAGAAPAVVSAPGSSPAGEGRQAGAPAGSDGGEGERGEAPGHPARTADALAGNVAQETGPVGTGVPEERESGTPPSGPARPAGPTGASLTADELASASGLSGEAVAELESFGLLAGQSYAGSVYYDEEALTVANLAAGLRRFGVEARHLKAYKNAADREAGLIEVVVTPLLKQRNPQARRRAGDTVTELALLGERLRASLLRSALRDLRV